MKIIHVDGVTGTVTAEISKDEIRLMTTAVLEYIALHGTSEEVLRAMGVLDSYFDGPEYV